MPTVAVIETVYVKTHQGNIDSVSVNRDWRERLGE